MKKILLGTSALVIAALAMPAAAQAPASGFSTASGMSVTIGGYARQYVTYTGAENLAGNLRANGVDQTSDNRLILTFRAALPSGMSAGAVWQINPNANTATGNSITRRMWSFLEGSFGQVQLGGADNVGAQMGQGAFEAFTGGFINGDNNALGINVARNGVTNINNNGNPSSGIDTDGIANKITYFTPRIEGFQAGINYTPEQAYRQGIATLGSQYQDGWVGALNYINTLGGVAVRASAAYLTWNKPSGWGNIAGNTNYEKPRAFNFGLGFQFQGIDIGGGYSNQKAFRNLPNGTTTTAAAVPAVLKQVEGNVVEAGIGYIFGAAAVSVNYARSTNKDGTVAAGVITAQPNGDDKITVWGASGRYTLAPGVNVNLGVFTAKYQEGAATSSGFAPTKLDSRTNGVVSGLTLAF